MTDLMKVDPRFQPVTFNGRTYITSTWLHKQKREGGMTKYEEHKNFMAMIREIDCFNRLISNTEIVELNTQVADLSTGLDFKPLMKSNSYKPLLLISPTAQKEIEHFLDDEASKDSAVKSSAVSATLDGGYGLDAAQALLKHFQDPRNLAGVFTQLAEATEKVKELEVVIPQLEGERDYALETKAHISRTREASVMGKYSTLLRAHEKLKAQISVLQNEDVEQHSPEQVQELKNQVKKLDKALEEYRKKEELQEEENQTYHPTSKNGIGINDALRKWGFTLTTANSKEISSRIRAYLSNIGGEICWADSTFKGAPTKRCLWHPQFLDKNRGRILNFLKNEGWLKKA